MIFKLSNDKLGIDLDYRILLKDFSSLYQRFNKLNLNDILNPNLNNEFWDKLVANWSRNNQIDAVLASVKQGIIPNFEEKIKIDWLNLTKRDYNYQWRLHSFDFCPLLISAYINTNDEKYLNIIFDLLKSWESFFIKNYYSEEVFPWNDHATANRTLNLSYLLFFLKSNSYQDEKQLNILKNIILCHIVILSCRNFYSFHTNHGLFQANHGYVASTLLRYDLNECNFQKINSDRMVEEFDFSFTSESVHKENSPEYHFVIFKSFLQFNENLKQLELNSKGFIQDVNHFSASSLKFLVYSIKPNGFLPTIGDTEEKVLDDLNYLKGYPNYPLYLYAQSEGTQGTSLPSMACAFEQAGYFFIKTNYSYVEYQDQFYLAAKSSFLSKYHRQDDDCNFVLSAYGEDWLVDGGLYRHEHHDPIREFMRSRYSHNLLLPKGDVVIDRQTPPKLSQSKQWGLIDWTNATGNVEAVLATQMFQGFNYQRKFVYNSPFKLSITDVMSKLENNEVDTYQLVFHFAGDKKITVDESHNSVKVESDNAILSLHLHNFSNISNIKVLARDDLPKEFIQKISKNYNKLESSQTVIFEIKSTNLEQEVIIKTNMKIEKNNQTKIFILGSCVTRDALELAKKGQFVLTDYLARTSIASAFQDNAIFEYDTSKIASAFQRRMVDNDLLKSTTNTLINTDFDFLVIDLIDERFDIVKNDKNQYFTLSSEFKDNISLKDNIKLLKPNDDELFELWCKGWDKFISIAKENDFYHKIILNKVFWTNKDTENKLVYPDYVGWIARNNQWLSRLYTYIEKSKDIKIISYPEESFLINKEHKWGCQPYHYADSLYLKFLDKLTGFGKQ